MSEHGLRLLSLDGGGVRGLSILLILKHLMTTIDPDAIPPPKPCEYFDMIGGTSTGGLIAIMLGRLQMTVDDCIHAYTTLSARVFQKKRHRLTFKGNVQGRFDSDELEQAIKDIVQDQKLPRDALLKDSTTAKCKVFVCATSCETGDTVRLRSYRSPRGRDRDVKIWEAGRATSAASSFFDPITVDAFGEYFVDGATGVNNPVYEVWSEAQDIWPSLSFEDNVRCLVSIGTGVPSLTPFKGSLIGIFEVLKKIATETQKTAELFSRDKAKLGEEGRYHRFDVVRGLEDVGLENVMKMPEIVAASDRYVESQAVFKQMNVCAEKMKVCAEKMVENDDTGNRTQANLQATIYPFDSLGKDIQYVRLAVSYWRRITLASYEIYEEIYNKCKDYNGDVSFTDYCKQFKPGQLPVERIRSVWLRIPYALEVYSKPYILAITYMLHVETYDSQRPSLDKDGRLASARMEILRHFDKWIPCTCSKMCEVYWNFVNTDGIYRAGTKKCKVVAAILDCESRRPDLVVRTSWNLGRLKELRNTWTGH